MSRSKGIIQAREDAKLLSRATPADFADAADVLGDVDKSVPLARSLQVQLAAALCRAVAKLEPGRVMVAIAVPDSDQLSDTIEAMSD